MVITFTELTRQLILAMFMHFLTPLFQPPQIVIYDKDRDCKISTDGTVLCNTTPYNAVHSNGKTYHSNTTLHVPRTYKLSNGISNKGEVVLPWNKNGVKS